MVKVRVRNNVLMKLEIVPDLNLPFEIARAASRTSGVAPLSVFFIAGFSSSDGGNRDFHDLEYSWNFDDSGAGNWGPTGLSKNIDKGGVSSHVFESSGTFTVSLTVRNSTTGNTLDTETFVITVSDPDTFYSGTNTTVINPVGDSDFSAKPTGATEVNTDDLTDLTTYTGASKRILLKRGGSWNATAQTDFNSGTTQHLGAYGTGTGEDSQGIFSNAPEITMTSSSRFISLNNINDLRITDISMVGNKTYAAPFAGATDIRRFLLHKVKAVGFVGACDLSHFRENDSQENTQLSVVSCDFSAVGSSNIVYMGCERLTLMGNDLADTDETHVIRIWTSYLGSIGHNKSSGTSLVSGTGRQALKFHGLAEDRIGTFTETGTNGIEYRTQFTMVHNNIFGTSGPWPVGIGPQNNVLDERLNDIIYEKNKQISDFGSLSTDLVIVGLWLEGRYLTARNNIFDGTGAKETYRGIITEQRGIEPAPLGIRIYNNTIYRNESDSDQAIGMRVGANATDVILRNNYVSLQGTGTQTLIDDISGIATYDNNTLTDTPLLVDPDNVAIFSRDFSLDTGSSAIDNGVEVPVLDDFDGVTRTGTFDQGAFNA